MRQLIHSVAQFATQVLLLCIGLDYKRGGFVDRALEAFNEVLRLDPTNSYAFVNLQKLHEEQHQLPRLTDSSSPDPTTQRISLTMSRKRLTQFGRTRMFVFHSMIDASIPADFRAGHVLPELWRLVVPVRFLA